MMFKAFLAKGLALFMFSASGTQLTFHSATPVDAPPWVDKTNKSLRILVDLSSRMFKWPRPLEVSFEPIGKINAFYSPSRHRISLGYELLISAKSLFSRAGYPEKDAIARANYYFFYVYFHELGHAVLSEFQLPVVGREEDTVDEFAAMMFVIAREGSMPVAACDYYRLAASAQQQDFVGDEHSLDLQRRGNIYAILYGADPQTFRFVEQILPSSRLQRSRSDFVKHWNSWRTLLQPAMITDAFRSTPETLALEIEPTIPTFSYDHASVLAKLRSHQGYTAECRSTINGLTSNWLYEVSIPDCKIHTKVLNGPNQGVEFLYNRTKRADQFYIKRDGGIVPRATTHPDAQKVPMAWNSILEALMEGALENWALLGRLPDGKVIYGNNSYSVIINRDGDIMGGEMNVGGTKREILTITYE